MHCSAQKGRVESRVFAADVRNVHCKPVSLKVTTMRQRASSVAGTMTQRSIAVAATPQRTSTSSSVAQMETSPGFDIQERVEFLKKDLEHLFTDQGIDRTAYDDVVEFRDPITKYDSLDGYLFNIRMLKLVFDPVFTLHDIQAVSPHAIITRWTMAMDFMPARWLPLLSKWWAPKLLFTGTSTYVFNPKNGRINRHIDTWDSIQNQTFFSFEAFRDFLTQVGSTHTVPQGLEQPSYMVLRRTSSYEVRRYDPFLAAQALMDAAAQGSSTSSSSSSTVSESGLQGSAVNPAASGNRAFGQLARFIFGGNARGEKMEMTTPVFTNTRGDMQFVIGKAAHQSLDTVPGPLPGAPIKAVQERGGLFAARTFGGTADEATTSRQAAALIADLQKDNVPYDAAAGYRLARYNDPGTWPQFRRNEVLVPLQGSWQLWREGEVEEIARFAGVQVES